MLAKFITADGCVGYREVDINSNIYYAPISFFSPNKPYYSKEESKVFPDANLLIREYEYYGYEYDELHRERMPFYKETRTR